MAVFLPAASSFAHDPGDPDAEWFNSLRDPNGLSCCGGHDDCETVGDYEPGAAAGSYRVRWRGQWVEVPAAVVLTRADNPTGLPVLCVTSVDGLLVARCFVRPAEG